MVFIENILYVLLSSTILIIIRRIYTHTNADLLATSATITFKIKVRLSYEYLIHVIVTTDDITKIDRQVSVSRDKDILYIKTKCHMKIKCTL